MVCSFFDFCLLFYIYSAKKRKKKNYTTPKKIKHKKKKVKLAVLKFYKVDGNGKISRLRRECTSETCGAGVCVFLLRFPLGVYFLCVLRFMVFNLFYCLLITDIHG